MTNTILTSVIIFICTGALGALGGFVVTTYCRFARQVRALFQLTKAHARREITDAYQAHVVERKKLTTERHRELTEAFEAYTELGGNGTTKRLWEELEELRPWLVIVE